MFCLEFYDVYPLFQHMDLVRITYAMTSLEACTSNNNTEDMQIKFRRDSQHVRIVVVWKVCETLIILILSSMGAILNTENRTIQNISNTHIWMGIWDMLANS